jgi:hypothetical protein
MVRLRILNGFRSNDPEFEISLNAIMEFLLRLRTALPEKIRDDLGTTYTVHLEITSIDTFNGFIDVAINKEAGPITKMAIHYTSNVFISFKYKNAIISDWNAFITNLFSKIN